MDTRRLRIGLLGLGLLGCGSDAATAPDAGPGPALDSSTGMETVSDAAVPDATYMPTLDAAVAPAQDAATMDSATVDASVDAAPAQDASPITDAAADAAGPVSIVPAAGTIALSMPSQPKGCIDRVGPADQLVFNGCGADVVFNVSVPAACMSKACGLIFDVHGWTMSGPIQEQNTGLAALGRQEGYIVVQPSAPGASWMAEMHDPVVISFLKLAMEVWQVEKRRVHFTGFSQGGAMTYRMRCALADTLASSAPVSMRGAACAAGTRAMDTLYVMGRDDVFVTAEEATQTVNSLLMTHSLTKDVVISMGDKHTFTRYKNAMGMVFEHLDHAYTSFPLGGHCFPGSLDAPGLYGCDEPAPFQHGRIVMDFFKAHPKLD